jgi:hypothetical protein
MSSDDEPKIATISAIPAGPNISLDLLLSIGLMSFYADSREKGGVRRLGSNRRKADDPRGTGDFERGPDRSQRSGDFAANFSCCSGHDVHMFSFWSRPALSAGLLQSRYPKDLTRHPLTKVRFYHNIPDFRSRRFDIIRWASAGRDSPQKAVLRMKDASPEAASTRAGPSLFLSAIERRHSIPISKSRPGYLSKEVPS